MIKEVCFVSEANTKQEVVDELLGAKVSFEQSMNGNHSFADEMRIHQKGNFGWKGKLKFTRIS